MELGSRAASGQKEDESIPSTPSQLDDVRLMALKGIVKDVLVVRATESESCSNSAALSNPVPVTLEP